MASVLFFSKDVARLIRNQQSGEWQQFDSEVVRGKVMGIVGYGETGRACAELARAFGMRVLGLRRHPSFLEAIRWRTRFSGPIGCWTCWPHAIMSFYRRHRPLRPGA